MIRGRARAAVVIGAIAVVSALVGAAIDRTVMSHPPRRPHGPNGGPSPEQEVRHRHEALDRMSRDLNLSNAQRAAIDTIMYRTDSSLQVLRREMQPRLRQVLDSSRAQIEARLDAEQRAKFAKSGDRRAPR